MSNDKIIEIHITEEYQGYRLDLALAKIFPDYSRSYLQNAIKNGDILVNGKVLRTRDLVQGGEVVVFTPQTEDVTAAEPQALDIEVVYDDDDVLVVNKASAMVTHPAPGNRTGTLLNAILYHYPLLNQLPRGGIIHRLDKGTSGLLVIGKNHNAYNSLTQQMQARDIQRNYFAIAWGAVTTGGKVDAPIGRHPYHRKQMAVGKNGRNAVTHYRIAERFRFHTALNVTLETGRTHQIRVHMAHIEHPLLGDDVYGRRRRLGSGWSPQGLAELQAFPRQALHAHRLALTHPRDGSACAWEAPLPEDITQLLALLRREEENNDR